MPFSRSICASTARATAMALLPGRLAIGERDRGLLAVDAGGAGRPGAEQDVLGRLFGVVPHLRHVPEVDGVARVDAHDRGGHVVGAGEEGAGLDDDVAVAGRQRAGDLLAIGRAEGPQHVEDSEPARGESGRVEMEPDLSAVASDEGGLRDLGHVLDLGIDLRRDPPQGQMVVPFRVEGQREDGHVVDRNVP